MESLKNKLLTELGNARASITTDSTSISTPHHNSLNWWQAICISIPLLQVIMRMAAHEVKCFFDI